MPIAWLKVAWQGIEAVKPTDKSLSGVAGIVGVIDRFLYWRLASLRYCIAALIFVCIFELLDDFRQVTNIKGRLDVIPEHLRDKFDRFVKCLVAAEVFITICCLLALKYALRAWWNNGIGYQSSVKLIAKSWLTFFFAPFVMYVVCPFAFTFRDDLLRRDICTGCLVSIMHLGPEFRATWATGCASEPKLAAIGFHVPPTGADMRALRAWPGFTWCAENKYDWESRVFGTRWTKLAARGIGMPTEAQVRKMASVTQKHQGVVPPALLMMAHSMGVPMDALFLGCYENKMRNGEVASLLAGNASSPIANPTRANVAVKKDQVKVGSHRVNRLMRRSSKRRLDVEQISMDRGVGSDKADQVRTLVVGSSGNAEKHSDPHSEQADLRSFVVNPSGPALPSEDNDEAITQVTLDSSSSQPTIAHDGSVRPHRSDPHTVAVMALQSNQSAVLLDNNKTPTLNSDPGKLAVSGVCNSYTSTIGFMRSARLALRAIRSFLGTYTTALAIKTLFPATFAIINGIESGVANVKGVLPQASTPGYMLLVGTLCFLPSFMLFLSMTSQLCGEPVISFALFMLCLATFFQAYKGWAMTGADSDKSIKKRGKEADAQVRKAKICALVLFLGWAAYMAHRMMVQAPEAEQIKEIFDDIRESLPGLDHFSIGLMIAQMVAKFIFVQMLTNVVFTDLLMVAVFDAADDELQAKDSGKMCEDKANLVKDWHVLCPPKKKTKKKKKKDKKDKGDKDGDSDDFQEAETIREKGYLAQSDTRPGTYPWAGPSSAQRGFYPGAI